MTLELVPPGPPAVRRGLRDRRQPPSASRPPTRQETRRLHGHDTLARGPGRATPRLRIGLLAPPWVPIPPPSYGGIEQVVATLAAGLVERGHEVVLVAAPGSRDRGRRVVSPLATLPGIIGEPAPDWRHALAGVDALADVDVVIDHSGPLGALLTSRLAAPGLHVTHGPLDAVPTEIYAGIARHSPLLRLVAISRGAAGDGPGAPVRGRLPQRPRPRRGAVPGRPEGYLAFLGRMSPEKGPADAIRIARAAGLPLLIGAKCREPAEHAYFAEHVAPQARPGRGVAGRADAPRKYELLGGARALLFPIDWPEPFGMVMIEAMACGTPVLATARGSVPEVVADGLTGFVRETRRRAGGGACGGSAEIDRHACRRRVAERFSSDAMTAGYERLARAEIARGPGGAAACAAQEVAGGV